MRWIDRPPRILCATAILWFAIVVVTFSDAGVPFPTWLAVGAFSIGLTVSWLVRLSLTYFQCRSDRSDTLRRNARSWVVTTSLIVTGFLLANTWPLLSIRVCLSATALRESGPSLSNVSEIDLHNSGQRVGLFRVREFSQFGSELRFITSECGLVDTCGIVFSPDSEPLHHGEDSYIHLFGPWWHWYQSW